MIIAVFRASWSLSRQACVLRSLLRRGTYLASTWLMLLATSVGVKAGPAHWHTQCAISGERRTCAASHAVVSAENPNRHVTLIASYPPGARRALLTIVTPLGVRTDAGVSILLDGRQEYYAKIERCDERGCFASFELRTDDIRALNVAKSAEVHYHESKSRALSLPVIISELPRALRDIADGQKLADIEEIPCLAEPCGNWIATGPWTVRLAYHGSSNCSLRLEPVTVTFNVGAAGNIVTSNESDARTMAEFVTAARTCRSEISVEPRPSPNTKAQPPEIADSTKRLVALETKRQLFGCVPLDEKRCRYQ